MATAKLRQRLLLWVAAGALLFTPGLAAAAPPGPTVGDGSPVAYDGALVKACGSNTDSAQVASNITFEDLGHCTLELTRSGKVLVLASASVGLNNSGDTYEVNFRLDHNTGLTGDDRTDRTVDAYPDSTLLTGGDGTDRNVALTAVYSVTAGTHTFALLWRRTEGSVFMEAIDATLSAVFIPDGLDLILCGENLDGSWTANSNTNNPTVKCSINVPRDGQVFVSADGWMGLDAPGSDRYEAANLLAMDGNTGSAVGLRYTDVYTNTGDGVDTTMATSEVFNVTPGLHEFKLYLARQNGSSSQARMFDAGIAALYVPNDSPYVQTCGNHSVGVYDNATTTYTALTSCTLDVPANSWALVSGTAGVSREQVGDSFEAVFGLAVDGLFPLSPTNRYVNIYPTGSDGTDASTADSLLTPVTAGAHTFNFVGRQFAGTGGVKGRYPTLFVLVPGVSLYLPLVRR